jgi:Mrp family chromosome partitioning ATPase/capsular polysaccharide biosynthesis protein
LGSGWTTRRVFAAVQVKPAGQSNIIDITARARTPEQSVRIANSFAGAALEGRRVILQGQVARVLARLVAQQRRLSSSDSAAAIDLVQRIEALRTVQRGPDPTLTLSQSAVRPTAPVGAPPWLIVALALVVGITFGTGAALLSENVTSRVGDEEEAVEIGGLPVLARVPLVEGKRGKGRLASPLDLPGAGQEAFRTLQLQVEQRPTYPATIMVTSASSGDGKTTCALNLAFRLVASGRRVVLIDYDLRKPDVGPVLGIEHDDGLTSLIGNGTMLADVLVQAPALPSLRVVTAGTRGEPTLVDPLIRRMPEIVAQARACADFVILDTPPLGEVSDALRIAHEADEILVVARPGHTMRANLELMFDLLAGNSLEATGFVLIGKALPTGAGYGYGYGVAPSGARDASRLPEPFRA